ncbi:HoxN/HupN/NixA family nickel/cobalt transporter [Knoellia koreensis]|uniref:Nickel/cobalt efflux system n=1 Tax=Knoellia koreensis TaxID=2730921 RepID=A0A849HIT6_9MICO|nr:HoxN/HupN/NixA family nickel/cobalt transporter [Knoellia sp. DB2414S]NNM47845.1 HoxN/HupN/NixA family nickel/cobalt transporter [Knoellia sp. DB2414S]
MVSPSTFAAATAGDVERRAGRVLLRANRRSLLSMAAAVAVLHAWGWGVLLALVVPGHYSVGGQVVGVGLGVTAYTLGMRHAFDADHIAAIDNTTRKLLGQGRPAITVGFWFSLGHSSVVFVMVALLAAGVRAVAAQVTAGSSEMQRAAATWGLSVSGAFLLVIGLTNMVALIGLIRVLGQLRSGRYNADALENALNRRGLLARVLRRVSDSVGRPWHMYPVGFLFGLGFDTVTEVGLLVLAGGAAASDLPWWAIVTLPVLFAAGMSLLDAADGSFMTYAYGWALNKPARKIFYNLTLTAMSVWIALLIGGIEVTTVLTQRLHIATGPLAAVADLSLDNVGFWIVGAFIMVWGISVLVWRLGRLEVRLSPRDPVQPSASRR